MIHKYVQNVMSGVAHARTGETLIVYHANLDITYKVEFVIKYVHQGFGLKTLP